MPPKRFQKNKKSLSQLNDQKHWFDDHASQKRTSCLCEASIHELINNCINCGRIVCEKEGSGACFTCGTHVFTKAERDFFLSNSVEARNQLKAKVENDGTKLDFMMEAVLLAEHQKKRNCGFKDIVDSVFDKDKEQISLQKATEHKDKLLEFDKNSVARSKVFDDQIDYFSMRTQNFISNDKKKEIGEKLDYIIKNKFEKQDKLVLDLQSGTISDFRESKIKDLDVEHEKLFELSQTKSDYQTVSSGKLLQESNILNKETLPAVYLPDENENNESKVSLKKLPTFMSMSEYNLRVQDKEQEIIEDNGMCLAMRQPWATLLVAGIKKFEGRSWYSPFKGRLWIYAAAHRPTSEEIEAVEKFYFQLGIEKFPRNYPLGEMVGCVTVEDCLPNAIYSKQYPECEVDSPYAFVCTYPLQFQTTIPVKKGGGDKIYPLQPTLHRQCKRALGF